MSPARAELLWGDAPPLNIAATIDTYASTLRRRLEPRRRQASRYVVGGGGDRPPDARAHPQTAESHVRSISTKLDLPPMPDDNRRVLDVVTHLRS